jgi:hypothetical protein
MGLTTGNFPPVDPATFQQMPYLERIKTLSRHWVDYGFGAPKITMIVYIVKVLVLYMCGGILVSTLTSDLDPLHPAAWWDEPIIWQKIVIWTVLLEALNLAGSWGPLAGKFKPFTGGVRYYARIGTLRNPPWPKQLPFTEGDTRSLLDVVLYLAVLASLVLGLALPGTDDSSLTEAVGANKGLVSPAVLIAIVVTICLLGLRDKIFFLAARSEQWLPPLIVFAFFPFVDMIVAAKLIIVMIWFGAGVSKLNRHFEQVISPMVSNTPWLPLKGVKRMHYRDFPNDLRPSKFAKFMAHGPGAFGELVPPLILLFSHNETLSTATAVFMVCYHIVHHLDVPAGGPAGVERRLRLHRRVPLHRLPQPRGLRARGHGHRAARADGRRDAGLPDLRRAAARQDLVPAGLPPVLGQLGDGVLVLRAGRRAQTRRAHRQALHDPEGASSPRSTARTRPRSCCSSCWAGARCTARRAA